MNVAVTINDTYFYPLYIMLNTLFSRHEKTAVHVYLIHSRVSKRNLKRLERLCKKYGGSFTEIFVSEKEFSEAPSFSCSKAFAGNTGPGSLSGSGYDRNGQPGGILFHAS